MRIIYNHILPLPGFSAMMLCGVIFARRRCRPLDEVNINHEAIHAAQAHDCGGWFQFYMKYLLYWIKYGYRQIPFEIEAYENETNLEYLDTRIPPVKW